MRGDKTLRIICGIEKQRGWDLEIGAFVIHCDDSFWREIVHLCLTRAAVVVVDGGIRKCDVGTGERFSDNVPGVDCAGLRSWRKHIGRSHQFHGMDGGI